MKHRRRVSSMMIVTSSDITVACLLVSHMRAFLMHYLIRHLVPNSSFISETVGVFESGTILPTQLSVLIAQFLPSLRTIFDGRAIPVRFTGKLSRS
jgi:hypothetical protein